MPSLENALRLGCAALLIASGHSLATGMPTFDLRINRDGVFEPASLEVPANTKFRLVVRNDSAAPEEFESETLGKEKILPPGAKISMIFQPLAAGRYDYVGEFHPERAKGTLIARSATP